MQRPAAIPHPLPRRVLVAGVTGVGKTTFAARVSAVLGIPHTEMDALYHGPNWVPRASFLDDVEAFSSGPAWVTEWQYAAARPLLAARADTLVWLDYPARIALWRLLRRTVVRGHRRTELWNGNTEPPLMRMLVDRNHIIWWALRTRSDVKRRVPHVAAEHPHLRIVRLTSQQAADRWLKEIAAETKP